MKRLFFGLLAAVALFPPPVACQTGRATVTVIDRGNLRVDVTPPTFTGEVGDTITFSAVAIDQISGDTIPSVFLWSSTDTLGVSITSTGRATLLRAGEYQVEAFVQRIISMIITRQMDNGSWREVFSNERQTVYAATGIVPPRLEIEVGQEVPLCAYLESDTGRHFLCQDCQWGTSDPTIVSIQEQDPGICPVWAPGLPFPEAALPISIEQFRRGSPA